MLATTIQNVLTAAAAAAGYSLTFYVKKRIGKDKQVFEPKKLAATVLVGAMLGISMSLTGTGLEKETIQTQLAAYTGLIALVESALKFLSRAIRNQRGSSNDSTSE
jgi:hypothetical protein